MDGTHPLALSPPEGILEGRLTVLVSGGGIAMAACLVENYNGYWVSTTDRRVRNFFWENTMIAESHRAILVAQTLGAGRGRVKVKLTFDGLVENADGEGIWIYDRDRWFWRITFEDAKGTPYVFVTFKEPRGPVPYLSYRTSVFGVLYAENEVVGHVRWQITLKEVSRLYKTIRPFQSESLNKLYRLALMYPLVVGAGSAYSVVTWAAELAWAVGSYAFTLYAGELISSDLASADYLMPYPHEVGLSNDVDVDLVEGWVPPV
ncbi:hypothetical protein WME99_22705 [Sorangium sp. So ce136]|uniref:hypothetical protein n=1 Tax=Sorangium sp. So ce136 TaxID=3133284 RepID=UPI003EFBD2D0